MTSTASSSDDAWAARLREWWPLATFSAVALALGAIVVIESRRTSAKNYVGELKAAPTSLGMQAFERVLMQGVNDGELQYKRSGMRTMRPFHKTFGDAKLFGISPTELAVSGRYFGEEVLPIRIGITQDGNLWLKDGREHYTAAKYAGARAILADVVLYDKDGDIELERRAAVRLL